MKKSRKVKRKPTKSKRREKPKTLVRPRASEKKSSGKAQAEFSDDLLVKTHDLVPNPSELVNSAATALRRGAPHEAFDLCREMLKLDPYDPGALNLAGVAAFQVGLADEALQLLETAVMQSPLDAEIHTNLGNVYAQLGREDVAKSAYEQAMKVDPNYTEAFFNFGVFMEATNHVEEATVALKTVLDQQPNHALAWYVLGNIYQKSSRLGEAQASFEEAIKSNPNLSLARTNLGAILNEIGDFKGAIEECQRAIKLDPDLYEARYNLGTAFQELGRHEQAIAAYQQVLTQQPNHAAAAMNIAYGLQQLGRLEEATVEYEKTLKIDPSFAKAHVNFADLKLQQGNPSEALAICNKFIENNSAHADLLAFKAMVLGDTGDKKGLTHLIDYNRLLSVEEIQPPSTYSSLAKFNEELTAHIVSHPTLNYEPRSHATRSGHHSGELLEEPMGPFADFKILILAAIQTFREKLDLDVSHPFLSNWPDRTRLSVWGVVMRAQGHQVPHIHPSACLSGVYYAEVPSVVGNDTIDRSGWLVLGQVPSYFHNKSSGEIRFVQPKPGLLVLFPSYFYHHTNPYKTDETRVSIAFDLIPD